MSTDQVRRPEARQDHSPGLGVLLAAARTSESALNAFYTATAPRLAFALSATNDRRVAEDVLVRTYRQVWVRPRTELEPLTDDGAVMAWLTRIALVELVSIRRLSASRSATADTGGPLPSA